MYHVNQGWLVSACGLHVPDCRQNLSLIAEALVLDMGLYSIPGFASSTAADAAGLLPDLPYAPAAAATIPQAAAGPYDAPGAASVAVQAATAASGSGTKGSSSSLQKIHEDSATAGTAAGTAAARPAAPVAMGFVAGAAVRRGGCVRLYQVLAPRLVERAHLFGNRLSFKEGCLCYDLPYFCAPGAASRSTLDPLRQQLAASLFVAGQASSDNRPSGSSSSRAALSSSRNGEVARLSAVQSVSSSHWWRQRQLQQQRLHPPVSAYSDAASAAIVNTKAVGPSSLQLVSSSALPVPRPVVRASSAGAFDSDSSVTFVFCSVVNPRAR